MAKVRVLRVMEYTYADAETAAADMECWHVQGVATFGNRRMKIKSTALPLEFLSFEEELDDEDDEAGLLEGRVI